MKKLLPIIAVLLFILMTVSTYSLTNFKYIGIAFDASGNILWSQSVGVNIKLIDAGVVVFEENHTGIATDQFGAYSVTVGTGTNVSGVPANVNASKSLKIKSTVNSGATSTGLFGPSPMFGTPIVNYWAWPVPSLSVSGGALVISVIPPSTNTIRWVARVEVVEVGL